MRVTDLKTFLVNADTDAVTSRPRGRNWLFVKVYTDEGITGVGEGGGWPYVVNTAVHELKHFLIGENPFEIERIWLKLYDILHGHGVTGAVRGGALSAIDDALWDIKGKALGVPVYELLGGKYRDRIRVYGHASTPEQAEMLIAQGYTAFKCGPSVETIKRLREAVGYDVEIGLHCHGQLTPSAAIRLGRATEQYEPAFFEEPTLPEDIDALAKVAEKVNIPIATGERLFTKWTFTELLSRNIVDIIQPEITRIGGITEEKKVSVMAEAHSVLVAPHDGSAGPVAEMANIHVLASIPNYIFLEHRATDVSWRSEVALGVLPAEEGYIKVPSEPGLGIDLDEKAMAMHPVKDLGAYRYTHRTPEEIMVSRTR